MLRWALRRPNLYVIRGSRGFCVLLRKTSLKQRMRHRPYFLRLSAICKNFLWVKLITMDGTKVCLSNPLGDMSGLISKTSSETELDSLGTFLSSQ